MNFTPKRLEALPRQTVKLKQKNIPSTQLARRGCAWGPCREITQEQGEGAELGGRKGTSRNRASGRSTKVGEKSVGGLVDPVPRGPSMVASGGCGGQSSSSGISERDGVRTARSAQVSR